MSAADRFADAIVRMTAEHWADIGLIIHEDPSLFAAWSGERPGGGTITTTLGENRARRPVEHGIANIDDGLRYFRHLAARGERDES